jgi:hypothetical protein
MSDNVDLQWQPENPERLANQFSRLGWIGFWIQVALLTVPILLLIYVMFLSAPDSAQRRGIDLTNYLSLGSLLLMVFSTCWFYWYTRIGRRINDPARRPSQASVVRALWIGLWAGCLGIFFSLLVFIAAVWRMLFVLLANPQMGIQIAPNLGEEPSLSLSAMDAVSLSSLLLVLSAELIVLVISLWLLFRTMQDSKRVKKTVPVDMPVEQEPGSRT